MNALIKKLRMDKQELAGKPLFKLTQKDKKICAISIVAFIVLSIAANNFVESFL